MVSPTTRRASRLAAEDGFTLIEVLVSCLIAGTGLLATVVTFDTSRDLVTMSERKEAAVHVGEQEIERILTLDYERVALSSQPIPSSDPADPAYYVTGGTAPAYRWSQRPNAPAPHTEPLAVDPAGALTAAPTTWSDGRLSGRVQRFVTWVDDAACGALCTGSRDYRRVTVAVTVDGRGGPAAPILLSTLVVDPDAAPEGAVVDGNQNPLADPSTTCREGGVSVECARGLGGSGRTWFLYDTPAGAAERAEITGDHATHATVAPAGPCGPAGTEGCPIPDLLGEAPPPAGPPLPDLYRYSSEQPQAGYSAGRVLRRDAGCAGAPTVTDNTRGAFWATAPVAAATTLTGVGGLSLHTQTLTGASAAVTLCLAFYDVPESVRNLVADPPQELGRAAYGLDAWPADAQTVAFSFDFRAATADVTVQAGHRIGVRMWPAAGSAADIAVLYDHPSHASSLQLNATGT